MNARINKISLIVLALILGLALISNLGIESTHATASWYNNSWQYRKSHAYSGISGGGPNWQIYLNVYNGSGTDSGYNIYLGGKFKTNFADLRFTDDDGVTLLDYWVDAIGATFTIVWVEVKDDVSSAFSIFIYYGNLGASSASSGASTFLYFEQFDGQWLSAGKWSQVKVSDNDWLAAVNDTSIYYSSPNSAKVLDDGTVTLSANSYTVLRSPTITWTSGKKVGLDFREYHLTTQTLAGKQYVMYGIYYGSGIGYVYSETTTSKAAWNPIATGWPTTTATTGYIELGTYTQVLVNAGDGIIWSCRFDNVRVRYSTGTHPTNGAYGKEEFNPPITVCFLSSKGRVYYNSSNGIAWTSLTNGTVLYWGGNNLGFMALPVSNKTYVNILVNSTSYLTGNPQVVAISGTTTIWVNFIDGVSLAGNATSSKVLAGWSFQNSTGLFYGNLVGNATSGNVSQGFTFINSTGQFTGSLVSGGSSWLTFAVLAFILFLCAFAIFALKD